MCIIPRNKKKFLYRPTLASADLLRPIPGRYLQVTVHVPEAVDAQACQYRSIELLAASVTSRDCAKRGEVIYIVCPQCLADKTWARRLAGCTSAALSASRPVGLYGHILCVYVC